MNNLYLWWFDLSKLKKISFQPTKKKQTTLKNTVRSPPYLNKHRDFSSFSWTPGLHGLDPVNLFDFFTFFFLNLVPSGKLTWQWKISLLKMYSPIEHGDFSIAILVYRRVYIYILGCGIPKASPESTKTQQQHISVPVSPDHRSINPLKQSGLTPCKVILRFIWQCGGFFEMITRSFLFGGFSQALQNGPFFWNTLERDLMLILGISSTFNSKNNFLGPFWEDFL